MDHQQNDADRLEKKPSFSDDTYDSIIAEIRASLGNGANPPASAPKPAEEPSPEPAEEPSPEPAEEPSPEPAEEPSPEPAEEPSPEPAEEPSPKPAEEPSPEPPEILKKLNFGEVPAPQDLPEPPEEGLTGVSRNRVGRVQVHVSEDDLNRPVFDSENPAWKNSELTPPLQREEQPAPKKRRKAKRTSCLGWAFRLLVIVALVACFAVVFMGAVYAVGDVLGLTEDDSNISMTIEPNTPIRDVAEMLHENDIIDYPVVFRTYLRYVRHNDVDFNYGTFVLQPSMSYEEIIAELEQTTESNEQVTLTFPEGYDVVDIAEKLQDNSVCTKADFIDAINNHTYEYDFLESCYENRDRKAYVLEGYLFPDTYAFTENQDVDAVVRTFLDNFDRKFTSTMEMRCINSGRSIDDVVTLASIIESEAPVKIEMARVSSVLQNRLNNPGSFPSLQCDPTSKYADDVLASEGFDTSVTDEYDTYKCTGLPAGAINNPGINAIKASLYPSETEYYFYCSNLSTGEFYYAATYEQHQHNLALAGLTE